MEIIENTGDGYTSLDIKGRLDASSAPEAEAKIKELLESDTTKLVINLKELEYISSAGLRVLLVTVKQIRHKNGNLVLCSLQDNVKEVFEISGFSSIFNIYDDVDEAVKNLG